MTQRVEYSLNLFQMDASGLWIDVFEEEYLSVSLYNRHLCEQFGPANIIGCGEKHRFLMILGPTALPA